MTTRERALAKPEAVRVVLKMFCVKRLLHVPQPTAAMYAEAMGRALEWWDKEVAASQDIMTEGELAAEVIEAARQVEGWGRVLRARAN